MSERRILSVILDGVGDRPNPQLDDRTPLEAADTPRIDALAERGATGQIDPLAPGIVPGSGTGHLGLFGYDPLSDLDATPSRGCIEALGLGIEPGPGRVAARGNFVTLADDSTIADRRAGRFDTPTDHQDAKRFVEAMNEATPDDVAIRYHPRMAYRLVVLLEDASPDVADTDPGKTGLEPVPAEPTRDTDAARDTAKRLDDALEAASQALREHPANDERRQRGTPTADRIVTRGLGPVERGETLDDRFGLDAAGIAGGNAYRGFANYVGMDLVDVPGATGDLSTDYDAKAEAAAAELGERDLVYLHVKAPDICGENGDPHAKRDVLEEIDAALGDLLAREALVVGLTGDHSTPCTRAYHSGDAVPLAVAAPDVRVDDVDAYDEMACARGRLGRVQGGAFLNQLLDLANRTAKTE